MRRRAQYISGSGWWELWGLMLALLIVASVSTAGIAHADSSTGSMHVVVPAPSADNKTVQGPVHTNVSISAGQATVGATYTLGWAKSSDTCATGFSAFTDGTTTVTADSSGSFTATFVWPDAANNTDAPYLICASDTANPTTDVITADQVFQVLGSTAPQVTIAQAPSATRTGKIYDAGGPVEVRGKGFQPPGTPIAIFVTTSETFSAQDYQPDNALKTVDGSQITSDDQGQFTAIVVLPTLFTGQLFLHAVSSDAVTTSQPMFPPSLVATRVIQISQPQATPTVQPSPTPSTNGTGKTKPPRDQTGRIVAIAALGGLSLVLFIIGGILIASVVLGSGAPPAPANGPRSQPDSLRAGPSDPQW